MKSFIPKRVNNKVVVGFLSFAKTVGKPFNRKNKIGRDAMLESIGRHFASFDKTGGFIEDQDSYKRAAGLLQPTMRCTPWEGYVRGVVHFLTDLYHKIAHRRI